MTNTENFHVVDLRGTPRERGRAHGEALRTQIKLSVERWKDALGIKTGIEPNKYLAGFLSSTNFTNAIQRWAPALLDEVHGISDGASLDFDTIYAYQLLDEEWWYQRYLSVESRFSLEGHCSGVALFDRPGLPTLIAQNMDVNSYYDGSQTLLRIEYPDPGLAVFVFTAAGMIALNGLNSHRIAVCVNTLLQLDHAYNGLPVAFVIRGLLEKTSLKDAENFLCNIKHASGLNYFIGSPTKAIDYECSANKVVPVEPYNGASTIIHTNHPLLNNDQGMYDVLLNKLDENEKESIYKQRISSERRFQHLGTATNIPNQTLTVVGIQNLLSETEGAPVCVTRSTPDWLTFGCTIMELDMPPKLHLAPGPPNETAFQTYQI